MAGLQRAPTPTYFVDDTHKEAMAEQFVAQIIFSLERLSNLPGSPIADDFLDLLARAGAVMLAADTNLSTPAKQRLGAETLAAHILRHQKRYRAEEAETGTAAINRILASNPIPDEMRRYWNDS